MFEDELVLAEVELIGAFEASTVSEEPPITSKYGCFEPFLVGGFDPSEKYWSIGMIIPIHGKIKNVPNHQPDLLEVMAGF